MPEASKMLAWQSSPTARRTSVASTLKSSSGSTASGGWELGTSAGTPLLLSTASKPVGVAKDAEEGEGEAGGDEQDMGELGASLVWAWIFAACDVLSFLGGRSTAVVGGERVLQESR